MTRIISTVFSIFKAISALIVFYRVLTFNNCTKAAEELKLVLFFS